MKFALKLTFALLIPLTSLASTKALVGYGSSDAVLPAKNQELFLMGFKLGFEQKLKGRKASEVLVIDQTTDGSQLGAIGSARRLLDKDVVVLVGFPTSQEALLASKLAKAKGVLSISAAAGHTDLGTMGPTVFTLGESMGYAVGETRKFAKRTFGEKSGLLINNPYDVFSKNQEDAYLSQAQIDHVTQLKLKSVHLKKDLTLDELDTSALKQGKYDYIVLTAYASESAKLLEQFEKNKIDLPMIVNSSWTMGDVDFGRRFLTSRKSPTYVASNWSQNSQFSPAFEKVVKSHYGRPATAEIASGYDLGSIVAEVLNAQKGPITKDTILRAFSSKKCFDDLSNGRICFDAKGGHALIEITFRQFTAKGFIPVMSAAGK